MTDPNVKARLSGAQRCAFDSCQAGGIILERAPRVVHGHTGLPTYHPGCWATMLREHTSLGLSIGAPWPVGDKPTPTSWTAEEAIAEGRASVFHVPTVLDWLYGVGRP